MVGSACVGALEACGGSGEPPTVLLDPDGATLLLPTDGAPLRPDASGPTGTLRLVHAAAGLPAIDFCTRAGPQDLFVGPVLGRDRPRDGGADGRASDVAVQPTDADADAEPTDADGSAEATPEASTDGGAQDAQPSAVNGVAPSSASQYVSVEASGTLEIAIVPAGTGSCGQPLAVGRVTLEPGRLKTVVVHGVVGDGGRLAGVVAFDDTPDVTPNRAKVRLIYATAGELPRLTATLYSTLTTPLGTLDPLSPLRALSDASAVDGLGYANVDPRPPPTTLGLREAESQTPKVTQPADFGLTGGSVHTGFVFRAQGQLSLLYCNDVSTDGPRTQCTVLSLP